MANVEMLLIGLIFLSCSTNPPGPTGSQAAAGGGPELPSGPCAAGLAQCGTVCVNLQEDSLNCGQCGQGCPDSPATYTPGHTKPLR